MDNQVLKISDKVEWLGVLDAELKTFDIIMTTEFGSSYNAYLIHANKLAVVETVKEKFFDTYEKHLRSRCNPVDIEYIIVNHTEPDHSGSMKKMLKIAPHATVIASGPAVKNLQHQIGEPFKYRIVKEGDIIDLGDMHLRVIAAPNLHWPDTIYTYLEEEQFLFTCDSFGAHFCDPKMFDDLISNQEGYQRAFKYYFDVILKPFSKFFLKALDKIRDLPIQAILPGHGPILRSHWKDVVAKTETLCKEYVASYPEENRVLVAYVSAYGYTKTIAEKIAEGLAEVPDIKVDLCNLEGFPLDRLEEKIVKASGYILGSPTINQNMLPQLYQVFAMMTPLREKDKLAACFGAYGWSGEAERNLISNIQNLKMSYIGDSMFICFRPQECDYERIKEYGRNFGRSLKTKNCR